MNDVCHKGTDFRCVNSRALWVKFTFSGIKVCVVKVYGLTEGDGEERERL